MVPSYRSYQVVVAAAMDADIVKAEHLRGIIIQETGNLTS